MMNQDRIASKADALAGEVLTLSRNTLLVHLRFLDAALSQLSPVPRPGSAMATDGQALYYDPLHVLRSYRAEHAAPVRDYLHLVLHCVFHHMFAPARVEPKVWDLACDIAVEHAISGLELAAAAAGREQKQRKASAMLRDEVGMLTAEKIYRYLLGQPRRLAEAEELWPIFLADDHRLWYAGREDGRGQPSQDAQAVWKEVSQRMQVDMETFARRQGGKAQAVMQNLREVNRETYDYTAFLQRFASRGEAIKADPEEFDYIFYTYGMELYKNTPLIEPLEYKRSPPFREFVLAVDLHGLICVEQARHFLRKIYGILKASESFSSQIHLHILTCGGGHPEHVRAAGAEELEEYLASLQTGKPGGADFRPVFLWMDQRVHRRAFTNLKGLLYFTDGIGPFPPGKPDYESVFVFVNDDYSSPDVPPWAIRLVLQKDELDGNGEP